ncbi:MAG: RNase adapter RapZ [Myxococcales bacterium]|nr:RNase adapter RapZ [Myxococcales bacterium]
MSAPSRWIFVVTGMGGAGRTTALRVLEDLAFYCIDNLPTPLVPQLLGLSETELAMGRLAVGIDIRVGDFLHRTDGVIASLRASGARVGVLFLDASDEILVRRYSESRRPHPLASSHPDDDISKLLSRERERLAALRAVADRVIDTTRLTVHDLRRLLIAHFSGDAVGSLRMTTRVISFGFKYGVPVDADLVFDARFLPNPHFDPALRPHSGQNPAVSGYVLESPDGAAFLSAIEGFVGPLLPKYAREGKVVLTVAVGCTGGRHRSVALAEALGARLRGDAPGDVQVAHRDIERGG